jgi:hypothetical protein
VACLVLLVVLGSTVAVVTVSGNDGDKPQVRRAEPAKPKAARSTLRKARARRAARKRRLAESPASAETSPAAPPPASAPQTTPAPKPSTGATPSVDSPEGRRILQSDPECRSHPPPPGYHGPVQC